MRGGGSSISGINLTHLYRGKIPYEWFPRRELGFVSRLWRGLAQPDRSPDEILGDTNEKPWIAEVDTHAIGGGCQILLVCDFVVAAKDAYMTLPARKEGIIPGLANLRLPRFVGDRIARQAIQYERRIDCDSEAGRMICDEIVPPDQTEAAVEAVADRFLASGQVGALANRRALQDRRGDFRSHPPLRRLLRARPGRMPFQPAAHRQSRTFLGRQELGNVKEAIAGRRRPVIPARAPGNCPLLPLREKVREARMRGPRREKACLRLWRAAVAILGVNQKPERTPHPAFGHLLPQGEKDLCSAASAQSTCLHALALSRV